MKKVKRSPQTWAFLDTNEKALTKVSHTRLLSCGSLVTGLSLLMLGSNSLMAQANDLEEDVYILDPFEVTTDIDGYKALDTLGGARVRTTLADTASSLSVITPKLMQDLNVTDAESLLIYTTNTEVSGLGGNFSGMASRGTGVGGAAEDRRLFNPSGTNRARGLAPMDNTRNYFLSEIPWDGYNISRIDISRGANSFLFGTGSPSGISNVSTNEAAYRDFGNIELHYGSYGSTRESFDYNKEILKNELAIRVDAVNDHKKFKQDPAYNHAKRGYVALRYDPSFMDTGSTHTKILFNYEYGNVDSNNPRTLPPMDYISGYFAEGMNQSGYDMFDFRPNDGASDPNKSPWAAKEDIHYAFGNSATYWFDSATGKLIMGAQSNPNDQFGTGVDPYNVYVSGFAHYVRAMNFQNRLDVGDVTSKETIYPGGAQASVTYLDKTLADPTIFDFFNKLIDGDNKREWQDWDVYNLNLVQSFFDDRLVFQGVVTHEDYERGMEGPLSGYLSPYISVDLDAYTPRYPSTRPEAEINPNVGRPFIAGKFNGGNNSVKYIHDNCQLTASYSLKAEDITSNDNLIKILGHQELTGLIGHYVTKTETRKWDMYSVGRRYSDLRGQDPTLEFRSPSWVAYLGDSFKGETSASGANLDNLPSIVPESGSMIVYHDGAYQSHEIPVYNSRDDMDDLYREGSKTKETLDSQAFMYQGYFLEDAIIPSFGWRRDKVLQQGSSAPKRDDGTNVAIMDYEIDDSGVRMRSTSTSYGLAVHLGKLFKGVLPEKDDISLYYFHGDNQSTKVRYSSSGEMLPQEMGETDDFSIQYDGFDNRVTLRLTYFKTIDQNASASYGQPLGRGGWLLDSLPSWSATFAAAGLMKAEQIKAGTVLPSDIAGDWYYGWVNDAMAVPGLMDNIASIMQNEFLELFPQDYWDKYGMDLMDLAAIKAGDWAHILKNGQDPYPWFINNTHLIHGTHPVIEQDLESKGYELEATIRPLPNWDITFNASRVETTQTKLGDSVTNYLESLADLYINSDLGRVANWGNFTSNLRYLFTRDLWGPYLTQVAMTGTPQPEMRKWNFKIISNYTFDEGALKGLNIGGAFRWADKAILGYGYSLGKMLGEDAWLFDVNKPYYGSADSHFDMWVGYQHKLTEKIDWRIQLNLRNVGENTGLETISVEPDGSVAQQRITNGMTYDLSLKFMF